MTKATYIRKHLTGALLTVDESMVITEVSMGQQGAGMVLEQ